MLSCLGYKINFLFIIMNIIFMLKMVDKVRGMTCKRFLIYKKYNGEHPLRHS